MFAGRPHEVVGNGSPRWMITVLCFGEVHRIRLTDRLVPFTRSPSRRSGTSKSAGLAEVVVQGADETSGGSAQRRQLLLARHDLRQSRDSLLGFRLV